MNDIDRYNSLAAESIVLKEKIEKTRELAAVLDLKQSEVKRQLLEMIHEDHVRTIKTEFFTISRVGKPQIKIVDEDKLKDWFAENELAPIIKMDYQANLPAIKQALKEGQDVPGVAVTNTEYISIK